MDDEMRKKRMRTRREKEREETRTMICIEYSRVVRCEEWQGAWNGDEAYLSTTVDEKRGGERGSLI